MSQPSNVPPGKPDIRRMLRERLAQITTEQRHACSVATAEHVAASPEWQRAQVVMLYLALPEEMETSPLAYRAWQAGKTVVVPQITSTEHKRMIPVLITSLAENELRQTHYGLREPAAVKPVPVAEIDFCIVPGLGYSLTGDRIGRGAGYYDRFLAQSDWAGTACGLAFEVQLLDSLPTDALDRPVDLLATELRLLRFRGGTVR